MRGAGAKCEIARPKCENARVRKREHKCEDNAVMWAKDILGWDPPVAVTNSAFAFQPLLLSGQPDHDPISNSINVSIKSPTQLSPLGGAGTRVPSAFRVPCQHFWGKSGVRKVRSGKRVPGANSRMLLTKSAFRKVRSKCVPGSRVP